MVLVREYIFVMSRVAIKCMVRHLIYVLILDGIRVRDHSFVTGNIVVNDLHDQMNYRYTSLFIFLLINQLNIYNIRTL